MMCQDCNKREATLHFTKIINGKKTETHLCDECAREKGDYNPVSNSFSIHQLLSGLLNFENPVSSSTDLDIHKENKCHKCGMNYNQFARIGRFGCAECYHTFQSKLDPVLKRVHSGNTSHTGKIPKRIGVSIKAQKIINELKHRLQVHIAQEEFEEAAKLRDEIRSLEKKSYDQGRDD